MAGVGDNSIDVKAFREDFNRIVNLQEEKDGIAADIGAEMAALKAKGYQPKIIRQVMKIAKMKAGEYEEQQSLVEAYLAALDLI